MLVIAAIHDCEIKLLTPQCIQLGLYINHVCDIGIFTFHHIGENKTRGVYEAEFSCSH